MDTSLFWSILSFLTAQTLAAVWWAASVSASAKNMKEDIQEIKQNMGLSYTMRDGTRLECRIDRLEKTLYHGHSS